MWYINWSKIAKKLLFVGALVLLYFIIDFSGLMPSFFSISKSAKDKLETSFSPTVIKEIKEISELSTAEYYGEVYADLLEVYNDSITRYGDSIKFYPSTIFYEFPALSSYFVSKDKPAFKRNLVYIGRGYVKMGFDFSALKDSNIVFKQNSDTIFIQMPTAKILNADINPWYIENKVIGFEVFKEEDANTRFTDAEIVAIKAKCKQKLINEALEMGLKQKSEQTGKELLTTMFQALSDKKVVIEFN
jgi:hypothetical protein